MNEKKDLTTVCTLSLVLGIVAFFCNPLYLMPIAAIVLGIVGIVNGGSKKGLAIAGLICGVLAIPAQVIADTILSVATMGIGFFVWFI